MLSHLRFHRRGPSNPSSPLPDQVNPWDEQPSSSLLDVSPYGDNRPRSSNSSQLPPTLPPIARVTSAESEPAYDLRDDERPAPMLEGSRSPPARPSYNGGNTGFIGGVALRNYQREVQGAQRQDAALSNIATVPDSHITRAKPPPPPINTGLGYRPAPVLTQGPSKPSKSTSFVAPTDLQQQPGGATGKRPAGTRLASEPASLPTSTAAAPEVHRARKGLPFLKNPMSTLLMRRRAGQNVQDFTPPQKQNEPTYDPRIRGTRVHDFSAPRPRKVVTNNDTVSGTAVKVDGELDRSQGVPPPLADTEDGGIVPAQAGEAKPVSPTVTREVSTSAVSSRSHEIPRTRHSVSSDLQANRRRSLDKPLPQEPTAQTTSPFPPRTDSVASANPPSAATSRANSVAASVMFKSSPSTMTARSGRVSTRASVMSALPKHMKSTSSRFSFDMIGAAKAEKLLEERHRQRQAEKQTSDPRDSTFDEFDGDFDYDAMMDDDGLEERIPGINADLEEEDEYQDDYQDDYQEDFPGDNQEEYPEEEFPQTMIVEEDPEAAMDPDNDQENFAGFVFQRSNPASSVTSPHTPGMLATPRDASGRVIGFAMTKDTTPDVGAAASPVYLTDPSITSKLDDSMSGLGIHGLDLNQKLAYNGAAFQQGNGIPRPRAINDDDLYFDEGLADELDFEHDGEPFDESIFDNVDTDQYGRPIPGAFAQAQAERASKKEASRRESDMISQASAQSAVSHSTAHTSLSAGLQTASTTTEKPRAPGDEVSPSQPSTDPVHPVSIPGQDLAYQAALAEAAQLAEAAGKFRRSSSPPLPADLTITSPTDSSGSHTYSHPDNSLDNFEDDPYAENNYLDDYELDDDAIIAEANASALAYDSDGWYGQEFGFYSAPSQPAHGHGPSTANNNLSAENMIQYGGYFGSAGQSLNRATSGRLVSREPNLTPITERSEYSNRNSIMSLIVPPGIGNEGRNSASLQSPGLAQLAMMADDDNISLSALLKLRSRAWGGSQASLASSREGSPRSERPGGDGAASPWGAGSSFPAQGMNGHGRKNSAFSLWSNSDAGSASGSPTLTMSMPLPLSSPSIPVPPLPGNLAAGAAPNSMIPQPLFSPPPPPQQQPSSAMGGGGGGFSPVLEDDELADEAAQAAASGGPPSMSGSGTWMTSPSVLDTRDSVTSPISPAVSATSPVQQHSRRPGMGHRHKGSADSISYRKEEESGDWVMERRRTAESGEVEILESEVLGSGRI